MAEYKHFKHKKKYTQDWDKVTEYEAPASWLTFWPCPGYKHFTHLNVGEETYGRCDYSPGLNTTIKCRRILRIS